MGNKSYDSLDIFFDKCLNYNSIRSMAKGEHLGEGTIVRYLKELSEYDVQKRKYIQIFWEEKRNESKKGVDKLRVIYDLDDTVFDVLSPDSAYWLGMIASDGCVYEKGNRISLIAKEEDVEHIEAFKSFIKYSGSVKHRNSVCNNNVFRSVFIEIYSEHIKNVLISKYNIIPRKSNIDINYFNFISDDFKLYFLLGYFDGDGYIYESGKEKKVYQAGIVGNFSFLNSVKLFLEEKYCIKTTLVRDNRLGEKYCLNIVQIYSLYLFCCLYKSFGKTCLLKRKFEKVKFISNVLEYKIQKNPNLKYNSNLFIDLRKHKSIVRKTNGVSNTYIIDGFHFQNEDALKKYIFRRDYIVNNNIDLSKWGIRKTLAEAWGITPQKVSDYIKKFFSK